VNQSAVAPGRSAPGPRRPEIGTLQASLAAGFPGAPFWTEAVAGSFSDRGRDFRIPRYHFLGPDAGYERIRLGLFAGVHGDEPAGCIALANFGAALAAEPQRAAGYELTVYPVCNPVGIARGTRGNGRGRDLNREFWRGSAEPEIVILERELRGHHFDGIITLHTDDTSEGLYGYARGRVLNEALLKPALAAAARVLPCDGRPLIDGFAARESVICDCFPGVLAAAPDQRPQPFDLIFETPGHAPLDHQAQAAAAALDAILIEYRRFIAYGQNL
jgi:protein MpaA